MAELLKPDICVIGGGAGGLSVASSAATLGAQVVLVERGRMGGDCLNVGCVPSKSLIAAARRAHAMVQAPLFGLDVKGGVLNFARVREHVHEVIAAIAPNDSKERYIGLGVRVIEGSAKFIDPRTVAVGEAIRIRARRFVIATGSSPALPPIEGLDTTPYLTNETVFDLDECPEHLVVIGAGAVGLELAQAFRRLGAEVTVLEAAEPLAREDPECAQIVIDALAREGIAFRFGVAVARVGEMQAGVTPLPEQEPTEVQAGESQSGESQRTDVHADPAHAGETQRAEVQANEPQSTETQIADVQRSAALAHTVVRQSADAKVSDAQLSELQSPDAQGSEVQISDVQLADVKASELEIGAPQLAAEAQATEGQLIDAQVDEVSANETRLAPVQGGEGQPETALLDAGAGDGQHAGVQVAGVHVGGAQASATLLPGVQAVESQTVERQADGKQVDEAPSDEAQVDEAQVDEAHVTGVQVEEPASQQAQSAEPQFEALPHEPPSYEPPSYEQPPREGQPSEVRPRLQLAVIGADGEETIAASHILIATGRRPNLDGLGLDAARIKYEPRGIVVDKRLRTSNKRVYAIGDVTGTAQFTHAANYHAGLVIQNALFRFQGRVDEDAIPRVTFTDPELAQAGLTEEQARSRGYSICVLRWPYHENDRAQAERETVGHIKVITSKKGRILGATIVGTSAGELISAWAIAISQELNIRVFAGIVVPYPTLAEIGKRAALTYFTPSLTRPLVRRIMAVLRLFR